MKHGVSGACDGEWEGFGAVRADALGTLKHRLKAVVRDGPLDLEGIVIGTAILLLLLLSCICLFNVLIFLQQ